MKLLKLINGKKTIFAAFYNTVAWPAIMIIYNNDAPDYLIKANMIIGLILTFIGLGHKGIKARKEKKNNNGTPVSQ